MRKILFVVVLLLAGCATTTHDVTETGEWSFTKSEILSDEHVVTVKGHGKVCYVFVEDMNARNAAALLWCEPEESK